MFRQAPRSNDDDRTCGFTLTLYELSGQTLPFSAPAATSLPLQTPHPSGGGETLEACGWPVDHVVDVSYHLIELGETHRTIRTQQLSLFPAV